MSRRLDRAITLCVEIKEDGRLFDGNAMNVEAMRPTVTLGGSGTVDTLPSKFTVTLDTRSRVREWGRETDRQTVREEKRIELES